jgi:Cd2+/Zn2+-exporting ATPase
MDCAEEVSVLRARLSRLAGVRELHFDVLEGRMDVEYAPALLTPHAIAAAVESVGMKCEDWRARPAAAGRDWNRVLVWISGVALASGLALQVLASGELVETLLAHGHAAGGGHAHATAPLALALFAAAMIAGASGALRKAWAALLARRADMNLLVVLSMAGAALLGEWTEAATLSFLFALAGRLETASLSRARQAIAALLAVAPSEASVVHLDHEHRVEIDALQAGATVRVRPGERIPCDGVVRSGASLVNQALITGESVAVEKAPGDEVFAGSLNESGTLEITATREARDTTLARMLRMVEDSRTRRAPSERTIEKFTRYYTPAILALALGVAVFPPLVLHAGWSEWAYHGMVILLISCPCAFVISTPVSVVAALASAARQGVLVKGGSFLEEAARIRALALDRHGILTRGRPEVARRLRLDPAAARALTRWEHWRAEEGGAFPLTPRRAADGGLTGPAAAAVEELSAQGYTIETRHEPAGCVLEGLCDSPRRDIRSTIADLAALGVSPITLLTGDPWPAARAAAAAAGIEQVQAELLPEDKARRVLELVRQHRHVAMAGDCSADAPALAAATLGISLGLPGSDLIRESADVVVMGSDLRKVAFLIRHARRTLRVIHQNIAFALILKAAFLAAALAGSATLWMAVAADMGATFAVTLNGLRLLRPSGHQSQ